MHRRGVTIVVVAVVTWGVAGGMVWRASKPPHRIRQARAGGSLHTGTSALARPARHVQGCADRVSAQAGDSVTLYVSTAASSYRVDAYRMGYYGGLGGRLVWRSQDIPGSEQEAGVRDTKTNMVEAPWQPSVRF